MTNPGLPSGSIQMYLRGITDGNSSFSLATVCLVYYDVCNRVVLVESEKTEDHAQYMPYRQHANIRFTWAH